MNLAPDFSHQVRNDPSTGLFAVKTGMTKYRGGQVGRAGSRICPANSVPLSVLISDLSSVAPRNDVARDRCREATCPTPDAAIVYA